MREWDGHGLGQTVTTGGNRVGICCCWEGMLPHADMSFRAHARFYKEVKEVMSNKTPRNGASDGNE